MARRRSAVGLVVDRQVLAEGIRDRAVGVAERLGHHDPTEIVPDIVDDLTGSRPVELTAREVFWPGPVPVGLPAEACVVVDGDGQVRRCNGHQPSAEVIGLAAARARREGRAT